LEQAGGVKHGAPKSEGRRRLLRRISRARPSANFLSDFKMRAALMPIRPALADAPPALARRLQPKA
jgi:hypothetical protein